MQHLPRKILTVIFSLIFLFVFNPAAVIAANSHSVELDDTDDDYLSQGSVNPSGSGDWTFEFWMKLLDDPTGTKDIFTHYQNTGNQRSIQTFVTSGEDLGVCTSADGITAVCATNFDVNLSLNRWYHTAWIYDVSAGQIELYIDGTSTNTFTGLSTSLHDSTDDFRIGAIGDSGGVVARWDGRFDDFRIWNDLRTSTEISDNYQCALTGTEDNLYAYWKLDNALTDEASSGFTLTDNNTVVFQTDVPFTDDCGAARRVIIMD